MRLRIVEQLEGETVRIQKSRQGRSKGGHCTVIGSCVAMTTFSWKV